MSDVRIERIDQNQVNLYWSWLADLLKPALLKTGSPRSLEYVRGRLLAGDLAAASLHFPNGAGVILLSMEQTPNGLACWLFGIAGKTKLKLGDFKVRAIEIMATIEQMAKSLGCVEMRIKGRDWSWLPGYERGGVENLVRKAL